jgi:hypothetical protein
MDCTPPGSSVHRILKGRILDRVAFSSSGRESPAADSLLLSHQQSPVLLCKYYIKA